MVLLSSTGSYKNYREEVKKLSPPIIPYIGIYLKDLTFIEENCNFIDEGEIVVNFNKMRMLARIFAEVQQLQQATFTLSSSPAVDAFLHEVNVVRDETKLRERSLQCEPPSEGKEEEITDQDNNVSFNTLKRSKQ